MLCHFHKHFVFTLLFVQFTTAMLSDTNSNVLFVMFPLKLPRLTQFEAFLLYQCYTSKPTGHFDANRFEPKTPSKS